LEELEEERVFYKRAKELRIAKELESRQRELQRRQEHDEWYRSLSPRSRKRIDNHANFRRMEPFPLLNVDNLPIGVPVLTPTPVPTIVTGQVALVRRPFDQQPEIEVEVSQSVRARAISTTTGIPSTEIAQPLSPHPHVSQQQEPEDTLQLLASDVESSSECKSSSPIRT